METFNSQYIPFQHRIFQVSKRTIWFVPAVTEALWGLQYYRNLGSGSAVASSWSL